MAKTKKRCIHRHTIETHPNCFTGNNIRSGTIIPDIHFPNEDKRAYALVMRFVADFKPDIIVNLGDLGNFAGVSHWNKKRFKLRYDYPVKVDLDMCYKHHQKLREINPSSDIYTLGGNHDEEWPALWLEDHPEMEGYFDYHRDMGFDTFNIKYIPENKQPLIIGKLRLVHGWFINLHHSKKHAEHIHHNIAYAHAHDFQAHTPKNVDPQHRFVAWSLGHLSDEKKAEYLRNRPTNWMLAFGVFYVNEKTGDFSLYPVLLPNHRFIWNGIEYKS